MDELLGQNGTLQAENDKLKLERDQFKGEKDQLRRQNDELVQEKAELLAKVDSLTIENEKLTREMLHQKERASQARKPIIIHEERSDDPLVHNHRQGQFEEFSNSFIFIFIQ